MPEIGFGRRALDFEMRGVVPHRLEGLPRFPDARFLRLESSAQLLRRLVGRLDLLAQIVNVRRSSSS